MEIGDLVYYDKCKELPHRLMQIIVIFENDGCRGCFVEDSRMQFSELCLFLRYKLMFTADILAYSEMQVLYGSTENRLNVSGRLAFL